jgi:hypothetical protein
MWRVGAGWVAGLVLAFVMLSASGASAQVGFDRLGGDYTSFQVRSGDPTTCAARCERDARCRAWAFSYPATETAVAQCWLKSRVPPRVASSCCVSGVRGASVIEPHSDAAEFGIDRVGGDYRNFELPPDPTGMGCGTACGDDSKCRAWTYMRPGYGAPAATCFLKEKVTAPQHRPCCISGVIR